jgi:hypothetical protein
MNNWCIFFVFLLIFLLGILNVKELTARRLYKSFGVKGLKSVQWEPSCSIRTDRQTEIQVFSQSGEPAWNGEVF